MINFRYGPVELYLVGFTGEYPSIEVLGALKDLIDTGLVRLLDLVLVTRSEDGAVEVVEVEGDTDMPGLGETTALATGLIGTDDIVSLSEAIEPGASAVLVALELAYARALAEQLIASDGELLRSVRIPAPVVNALLDIVEQEEGD